MVRIEKTEINCSAFIILTATLKELQNDRVVEIVNDGRSVRIRNKEEFEKEEFTIDLTLMEGLFDDFIVKSSPKALMLDGKDEEYLRNLSFACDYYKKEEHYLGEFDHFGLFHNIHFVDTPSQEVENTLLRLFCGLFRIDFVKCQPFLQSDKNIDLSTSLPTKEVFNQVFESIIISSTNNKASITFESCELDYRDALNTLYSIKDLLAGKRIDVSQIPEHHVFSVSLTDRLNFEFTTINNYDISIVFMHNYVKFEMINYLGIKKDQPIRYSKFPTIIPSSTPQNALCPCGSGKKYKRCHGLN